MSNETTRKEFLSTAAAATAGAAFFGSMGFSRTAMAAHHEEGEAASGTISQLASFTIQDGKEEEAVQVLTDMVKGVEESEPGVLTYIAHRSKKNPNKVIFFEVYKDQKALADHSNTPHMNAMRAKFMQLFAPPVDIEGLDTIYGVNR